MLQYSAVYYSKKYFVLYFSEYFTHITYFTPRPNVSIIAHIYQFCIHFISQHQLADGLSRHCNHTSIGRQCATLLPATELLTWT